jgi:hypothetical protein
MVSRKLPGDSRDRLSLRDAPFIEMSRMLDSSVISLRGLIVSDGSGSEKVSPFVPIELAVDNKTATVDRVGTKTTSSKGKVRP